MTSNKATRVVPVVSWVYWNGDEQGGGGFYWFADADGKTAAENAAQAYESEVKAWEGNPARVRLLHVEVPADLDGDALTAYFDGPLLDDLEVHLPAVRESDTSPKAGK